MADTTTQPAEEPVTAETDGTAEPVRQRRWHVLLVLPAILVVTAAVLLTINLMGIGPMWFERAAINGPAKKNFVLDTFILCLLLGAVVFLSGRFWIPAGVFAVIGFLAAFANGVKLDVRNEPIFPSDLVVAGNTGFLNDMVTANTIARILLVVGVIILATVLLAFGLKRWFPRVRRAEDPVFWKRLFAARMVCALICIVMLAHTLSFNEPGNLWRKAYDRIGSHWTPWDQDRNYRRNGFVGGFLYNVNGPTMTQPPGYSEATMREVAEKYTALAEQANADRVGTIDDVNIVVVLSEAFSDLQRIKGLEVAEDPIPYTRRLMSQTYSGQMLAQLIGGGTANMEFEVLTGLSLSQFAPQMSTPYQMLLPRFRDFPGAAGYLTDRGHAALAVHPYSTRMYKRTTAYPVLGLDTFVDNSAMQSRKRVEGGRFISDAAAFAEVTYQIEQHDEPTFINLVTMQNHYPWNKQFDAAWPVGGVGDQAANQIGRYARGLNLSDFALADFLTALNASDEKTAVVFYGDHLPGVYPQAVKAQNTERNLHETPFFLWTNFKPLDATAGSPTTSPIYFLPQLFDQIEAPVPPMFALLNALHEEIPAMALGRYIDASDQEVSYDDLSDAAKALLRDYRLVQYDLAAGKQYSAEAMYATP